MLNNDVIEKNINNNKVIDYHILDDKNVIFVINGKYSDNNDIYNMIHKRLVDGKFIDINKWNIKLYPFRKINDDSVVYKYNLFQVYNSNGEYCALYDYKKGEFIVPFGVWDKIELGNDDSLLDKFDCFIAYFNIFSDHVNNDDVSFIDVLTNKKIVKSFKIKDGTYFALLNIDGTIKGNKLFKGDSLSEIVSVIDLNEYESLDSFKQKMIQECNIKKEEQKQEYNDLIKSKNIKDEIPLLDKDIVKILKLKY